MWKEIGDIIIPVVGIVCLFGMPVYFHYKKEMLNSKATTHQNADSDVAIELRNLRNQIAELRDTTTRYDMSFDSALQRLENRMTHMEGQVNVKSEEHVYSARVD